MNSPKKYDFIFLGAGCGSLSLLIRMLQSGKFRNKKFLLIDKEQKNQNDRTWCFWEKGRGLFEEIVFRKWGHLDFISDEFKSMMQISPYSYKMIRGSDFYNYCFSLIRLHPNVETIYQMIDIERIWQSKEQRIIRINNQDIDVKDSIIFNSIYSSAPVNNKQLTLLQHFKGWVIETPQASFNPEKPILMDFRVHQDHGTAFAYILPFSVNTALIEYTLFTKSLLEQDCYDIELKNYIQNYQGISDYRITEEEFGVIPMTNQRFEFWKNGMFHIGAAGGQTKASSGYTFQFIQKQSNQILSILLSGSPLTNIPSTPARFRFYDNTLLKILYHDIYPGKQVFSRLFENNPPQNVLRFLDNESSLLEELRIISSLPKWPFLKSMFK